MKKIITGILIAATVLVSCDKESELEVYRGEAIGIAQSSFSTSVAPTGTTLSIPVTATSVSDVARTFNAEVISADNEAEFTLGSVNIPAGSFDGTLDVNFDFNAITGDDGTLKNVQIGLPAGQGVDVFGTIANVDYFKQVICNDLELEVVSDIFGTETSYDIKDSSGNVVAGAQGAALFGGNSCTQMTYTENITLPDGDYTLTVYDSFGDGQVGNNAACGTDDIVGSYSLTCSIIVHAEGSVTGFEDIIQFSVN